MSLEFCKKNPKIQIFIVLVDHYHKKCFYSNALLFFKISNFYVKSKSLLKLLQSLQDT